MTGYLNRVLPPDWRSGFEDHLVGCTGSSEYVRQILLTVEALPVIDNIAGGT